jgi:hypothetical protein
MDDWNCLPQIEFGALTGCPFRAKFYDRGKSAESTFCDSPEFKSGNIVKIIFTRMPKA